MNATAYVLNELAPEERTEFEEKMRHDETLRREVEEIRATVLRLEEAFESEPAPIVRSAPRPSRRLWVTAVWVTAAILVVLGIGKGLKPQLRAYLQTLEEKLKTKSMSAGVE